MVKEVEFILGPAGTGKTRRCLDDIVARIETEPLGRPRILLLPEHMTYRCERELAARVPRGHGFLRTYVLGFRRLAYQVLVQTGGANLPRISEVGRRLLLRRILLEHQKSKDLRVFARQARQRGFTEVLSDAIREVRSYRLTPDLLRETADALDESSSRLAGKLTELATLTEEFSSAMAGHATDAEDMMDELAVRLPQAELARGAEVWIDGFMFFNPQEKEVLKALFLTADTVHIALPLAVKNGSIECSDNQLQTGLFARQYRTYHDVSAMLNEIAPQVKRTMTLLTQNRRAKQEDLQVIASSLFAPPGRKNIADAPKTNCSGLRITEAANRRLEVESVAADILRLVRDCQFRYREIGVLIRDEAAYEDNLPLVFADYGIPFFTDGKRQGIHHPLAELMRSAVELVLNGWQYETMLRCLRTGFFPLVPDDIDELENYVLEFGIRGRKRWNQEENWSWHRRYSLDDDEEELSEERAEKLVRIDALRRQAAEPLCAFDKEIRAAKNVTEQVTALYHFLAALEIPAQLATLEQQAEHDGRLADALLHRQIWTDSMELFDQLVQTNGDEEAALRDFAGVLGDGLDAMQISLIPPGLDAVTVASFDQNSLDNARAIYILGAGADTMPRRVQESGILTDADRLHIADTLDKMPEGKGAEIFRGGRERSFGERFLLYRGFNEAREYLWVSYALADNEGNGLQPSPYIARLRTLLPDAKFLSLPLETVARNDELVLAAPRPALAGLSAALRGRRDGQSVEPFWRDVYNWARGQKDFKRQLNLTVEGLFASAGSGVIPPELARQLFLRNGRLRGSVTQFEQFRRCPFAHFASYGLKLQERRTYQFRSLDLGQLLHAVLRAYGERVRKDFDGHWQNVPSDVQKSLCHELIGQLTPRLQSEVLLSRGDYRHLQKRIEETAVRTIVHLSAWAAVTQFRPAFFEESFGHANDRVRVKPLPLEGGYMLSFKGQIDRLDVDETAPYFLIIDYKTGQAAVNVFEVYYGLRLQLLTYLLVGSELLYQQGDDRLPAGMLYAFLQNPLIQGKVRLEEPELRQKIEKELAMPGWVLADLDVVRQIDASLNYIKPGVKSVKKKKGEEGPDEAFDSNSKPYIRSAEEFELLLSYAAYILQDTGNEILRGNIKAEPFRYAAKQQNACTFCPYDDVCGFDPDLPGCGYHDIKPMKDDECEPLMENCAGRKELWDEIHGRSGKGHHDPQ